MMNPPRDVALVKRGAAATKHFGKCRHQQPLPIKNSYKEADGVVYIFYTGSFVAAAAAAVVVVIVIVVAAATGVALVTSLSFSAIGESSVPPVSTLVAEVGSSELGIGFSTVVPTEGRLAPLFIRLLV